MSNAELNERDLANVSGGQDKPSTKHAEHVCKDCPGREEIINGYTCTGGVEQLALYNLQHGVSRWAFCPYLKRE